MCILLDFPLLFFLPPFLILLLLLLFSSHPRPSRSWARGGIRADPKGVRTEIWAAYVSEDAVRAEMMRLAEAGAACRVRGGVTQAPYALIWRSDGAVSSASGHAMARHSRMLYGCAERGICRALCGLRRGDDSYCASRGPQERVWRESSCAEVCTLRRFVRDEWRGEESHLGRARPSIRRCGLQEGYRGCATWRARASGRGLRIPASWYRVARCRPESCKARWAFTLKAVIAQRDTIIYKDLPSSLITQMLLEYRWITVHQEFVLGSYETAAPRNKLPECGSPTVVQQGLTSRSGRPDQKSIKRRIVRLLSPAKQMLQTHLKPSRSTRGDAWNRRRLPPWLPGSPTCAGVGRADLADTVQVGVVTLCLGGVGDAPGFLGQFTLRSLDLADIRQNFTVRGRSPMVGELTPQYYCSSLFNGLFFVPVLRLVTQIQEILEPLRTIPASCSCNVLSCESDFQLLIVLHSVSLAVSRLVLTYHRGASAPMRTLQIEILSSIWRLTRIVIPWCLRGPARKTSWSDIGHLFSKQPSVWLNEGWHVLNHTSGISGKQHPIIIPSEQRSDYHNKLSYTFISGHPLPPMSLQIS
ncbi:hypothetical protein C8R44DRAFT_753924 [Mycena epipterygia]|nr:hypothetical protein C8R44DRAFT_753924 [Mycena epipterygia]